MKLAPMVLLALAASCSSSSEPDARTSTPLFPDAAAAAADARPTDARPSPDAAPGAPDARAPDAASPTPDAPLSEPDAMVVGAAELLINEANPHIDSERDLVELVAVTGGSIEDITLVQTYPRSPVVLGTLPAAVVAQGDLIVVHMFPSGTSVMTETTGPSEHDTVDNFDGAWDVAGEAADLLYTNVVVALRDAEGHAVSAVPFFRPEITDPDQQPRYFPDDVQGIIDEGLWSATCTPSPCTYSSNLGEVTVPWTGVSNQRSGASVARDPGQPDTKLPADWQPVAANTFGASN